MQSIPLESVSVAGVLDRDVTAHGVVFRRLPSWTRVQLVDPALALLVTMPAGARLEFLTDATAIELDVMLTAVKVGDRSVSPTTFDLVVDREVHASLAAGDHTTIVIDERTQAISFEIGRPATIRFDGLPGTRATRVEIWLAHGSVVELRDIRVSDGATVDRPTDVRRRWVHYGSSISHCLEATSPTGTWPAVAARMADVDLTNLAVAGQCMLDQHVARTIRDLDVDLISVKAGINVVNGDTMRERTYVPALHGFLDTVREGHPTTPLLVITPIICPDAEDHPGPTLAGEDGRFHVVPRPPELAMGALTLRRIRELMAEVVEARRADGDDALHLLDGTELFGVDDLGDLPDGLHPNADGYRRMGERFNALAFYRGPFSTG